MAEQPIPTPPPFRTLREIRSLNEREQELVIYSTWATIGYLTVLMRDVLNSKNNEHWEKLWKMLQTISFHQNPAGKMFYYLQGVERLYATDETAKKVYNNARFIEVLFTVLSDTN
jgi:hypothetical protein